MGLPRTCRTLLFASIAIGLGACNTDAQVPVIGGPCEGCEGVFVGLPDEPPSSARIAPETEPGEPLRITGTVYDRDGRAVPGVIVYAYQTNAGGTYPTDERLEGTEAERHGSLRGFARSDAQGRYRFDTIRPGGYPGRDDPQHVHIHVIEPDCCTYWIASVVFDDDPRLDEAQYDEREEGRGGSGITSPSRTSDGVWVVRRDIHLGRGVPGYETFVRERFRSGQ